MSYVKPPFKRDDLALHAWCFYGGLVTAVLSLLSPALFVSSNLLAALGLCVATVLLAFSGWFAWWGNRGLLRFTSLFPTFFSTAAIENMSPDARRRHARLSAAVTLLLAAATTYGAVFLFASGVLDVDPGQRGDVVECNIWSGKVKSLVGDGDLLCAATSETGLECAGNEYSCARFRFDLPVRTLAVSSDGLLRGDESGLFWTQLSQHERKQGTRLTDAPVFAASLGQHWAAWVAKNGVFRKALRGSQAAEKVAPPPSSADAWVLVDSGQVWCGPRRGCALPSDHDDRCHVPGDDRVCALQGNSDRLFLSMHDGLPTTALPSGVSRALPSLKCTWPVAPIVVA